MEPRRAGAHRSRRRSGDRAGWRRDAGPVGSRGARQRHDLDDRCGRRRQRDAGTRPRRDASRPPRRRDLRQPRNVRGHGARHRHARHQTSHRRQGLCFLGSRCFIARARQGRAFWQDLPGKPMSDLRDWLKRAKLDALAETLEANDIGLDILPELSETDLAEIGLTLGNRRRLLKALAEIPADAPAPAAAEPAGEAERRQVTVMFCDLVGSTALSGSIDPEHLGDLIRRYGGFVAKFMGDGILAYFGFPQAFEDAAERAVRASLAIVAEVQGIARPDGAKLQTRIGIATGLVVVGELIGAGASQERTIVGETPNLAARLQALAAPDQIVVAESTQHLVGG